MDCFPVIVCRYVGWTDKKPSRIIASHRRDSSTVWRQTVTYDDSLSQAENHHAAAYALASKWPLSCRTITAAGYDAKSYYFVVS